MRPVYLDHNATTPLDPRVAEVMRPWLTDQHGNPSSLHVFGRRAREAVEAARTEVAALIGAEPTEVVFCGSGSEANNGVIDGVARAAGYRGRVIISSIEHPSVRLAADRLEAAGMVVIRVQPGPDGVVPAEEIRAAITADTRLVCLMQANNELGTVQPVAEVAAFCREHGIPVHTDAVQAAGKIEVDVHALGVDFLVLGAHKFHGPLGAAALWTRSGTELSPFLVGGSQERRRRASTENVPAIVGFGEAARLAREELPQRQQHLAALRDRFEEVCAATIEDALIHCTDSPRLPHTSHVAFLGLEGESLLIRLDLAGFAVSTGSACSSGVVEPSPTLIAIGLSPAEAIASLRISFGLPNRLEEVDAFCTALAREVAALRELSPAVLS